MNHIKLVMRIPTLFSLAMVILVDIYLLREKEQESG